MPKLGALLENSGPEPSALMAVPHLSGATVCWSDARKSRGALLGLNLASSQSDIIKSLMESIAYDLLLVVRSFRRANIKSACSGPRRRARGLVDPTKADLTGVPIEVVTRRSPERWELHCSQAWRSGTYCSLEEGSKSWISATRRYPRLKKSGPACRKLETYQATVSSLLRASV